MYQPKRPSAINKLNRERRTHTIRRTITIIVTLPILYVTLVALTV